MRFHLVAALVIAVHGHPFRTGARKRSQRVDALAPFAKAWQDKIRQVRDLYFLPSLQFDVSPISLTRNGFALINIHALSGVDVFQESRFAGQRRRTLFAGVSPGLADGRATEVLRTHDALQGPGAHVIFNPSKLPWQCTD